MLTPNTTAFLSGFTTTCSILQLLPTYNIATSADIRKELLPKTKELNDEILAEQLLYSRISRCEQLVEETKSFNKKIAKTAKISFSNLEKKINRRFEKFGVEINDKIFASESLNEIFKRYKKETEKYFERMKSKHKTLFNNKNEFDIKHVTGNFNKLFEKIKELSGNAKKYRITLENKKDILYPACGKLFDEFCESLKTLEELFGNQQILNQEFTKIRAILKYIEPTISIIREQKNNFFDNQEIKDIIKNEQEIKKIETELRDKLDG